MQGLVDEKCRDLKTMLLYPGAMSSVTGCRNTFANLQQVVSEISQVARKHDNAQQDATVASKGCTDL